MYMEQQIYTEQGSFRTEDRSFTKPVRAIQFVLNSNNCHTVVSHRPNAGGYARIKIKGKLILMHRYIWEKYNGAIPENMCICHTCDNRLCINPEHLFIGSTLDNMQDMTRKGRHFTWTPERRKHLSQKNKGHFAHKGSASARAKLTEKDVLSILTIEAKVSCRLIAKKYNVSESTISMIRHKRSWKHVSSTT